VESIESVTLRLLAAGSALKRLPRSGWLLAGVPQPESVADHSFATALLAYWIAEEINRDPASQGLAAPLDVGQVLAIALLHDLAESSLTDLPRRATVLLGEAAKHAAEEQVMAQLFAGDQTEAHPLDLWREYAAAATAEARLVRDADKLEMVSQALVYEQAGQRNLDEFWEGHRWHYPMSRQIYEALRRRRAG
jgi:putative hydrolase of HD superfamily